MRGYHTLVGMKRTTVFADEDDLALLQIEAARLGVSEAQLIREAIHLAALRHRRWSEPFFSNSYPAVTPGRGHSSDDALEDARSEQVAAYERTKRAGC